MPLNGLMNKNKSNFLNVNSFKIKKKYMKIKLLLFVTLLTSCFACKKDAEIIPVVPETSCNDCCGILPKYSKDNLQFIVDGNSMVAGYYISPSGVESYTSNYPNYIQSVTGVPTTNLGYGGIRIWQMVQYSGPSIDANFITNDSINYVLIVDEGVNSLTMGASADSTYNGYVKYCQDRKAAHPNLKIILLVPTPAAHSITPANFERERQILLQKLYSDFDLQAGCYAVRKSSVPMYADLLVDLAADSLIGYVGAEQDTTYYWDKLHHTPAGYKVRGDRVMTALNVLLK